MPRSVAVIVAACLAIAAVGCASSGESELQAHLRSLPPDQRRQAELQLNAMAAEAAAGYLIDNGVPLATVDIGPAERTEEGWAYRVWRRGDPSAATVVRVYETAEVRTDGLDPLRPRPEDLADPAADPSRQFEPVQVERNTGVDPAGNAGEGPFGP